METTVEEMIINLSNLQGKEANSTMTHKIFTEEEGIIHGRIMTCTICGVLQVSVLIQRHFKTFRYTSFIHGFLGFCTYGLVIFAFFNFYQNFYVPDTVLIDKVIIHIRLGFTVCTLITLQVVLGIITKVLIMHKKSMYLLLLTRKVHHMIGWIICLAGLINVNFGWNIRSKHHEQYYVYSAYGIITIINLISEYFRRRKVSRSYSIKVQHSNESSRDSELISSLFTYSECIREVKKHKKKWIFFNDLILDVSSFTSSHPGGSYLLEGILGEDSSKYVYGITNYTKEIPPSVHSSYALKLTKQFSFSRVSLPTNLILSSIDISVGLKTTWSIVQVIQKSSSMTCLELQSSNCYINPMLCGFEWMGFHFRVKQNNQKRFYSFVAANLEKWAEQVKELNLPVHLTEYKHSVVLEGESLRLFVKKYPRGNVSKYLTALKPGDLITLKGPFGPGLGISRLPKGKCIAFAAGTGILPFLDLVHAIWKDAVRPQFLLYLYASFSSRDDAVALDLLEATHKRFKEKLKLQINLDKEKIGVRLTRDNVKNWISEDLKLVWICGPASFNRFVQDVLAGYQVTDEKIIIL